METKNVVCSSVSAKKVKKKEDGLPDSNSGYVGR